MKIRILALFAVGLFIGPSHAKANIVDTTGEINDSFCCLGEYWEYTGDTATVGQTFTVGEANVLENFTFLLRNERSFIDFRPYVFEWDGSKATGTPLFSGSPSTTSLLNPENGFTAFTFDTGSLSLTSGAQYVAFFSTTFIMSGVMGSASIGTVSGGDVYDGGSFVYINNQEMSSWNLLTSQDWIQDYQCAGCDLAFRMEFSGAPVGVPEPGTLALLGVGLVGIGVRRRIKAS